MKAYIDLAKVLYSTEYKVLKDIEKHPYSSIQGRCIRVNIKSGSMYHSIQNLVKKELVVKVDNGKYNINFKSFYKRSEIKNDRHFVSEARRIITKWNGIKKVLVNRMHSFTVFELMQIREFENIQK